MVNSLAPTRRRVASGSSAPKLLNTVANAGITIRLMTITAPNIAIITNVG